MKVCKICFMHSHQCSLWHMASGQIRQTFSFGVLESTLMSHKAIQRVAPALHPLIEMNVTLC